MKIKLLLVVLLIPGILTTGCRNKKTSDSSGETKSTSSSAGTEASLPFLSSQDVNTLYSQAEKADIIFYQLPISVSQDDPGSAKNSVLYIVPASPNITSQCEPVGRLSWNSNGVIVREADFYIGEGCNHFVFIENGKPVYKNAMSPEGVQFFQTIMSQVKPPDKK